MRARLALSIVRVSVRPPCHPGRSHLASPVGDHDYPCAIFPNSPWLKGSLTYAPGAKGLPRSSTVVCRPDFAGTESGTSDTGFPNDEQLCNGLHSLSYVPGVAVTSNGYAVPRENDLLCWSWTVPDGSRLLAHIVSGAPAISLRRIEVRILSPGQMRFELRCAGTRFSGFKLPRGSRRRAIKSPWANFP